MWLSKLDLKIYMHVSMCLAMESKPYDLKFSLCTWVGIQKEPLRGNSAM